MLKQFYRRSESPKNGEKCLNAAVEFGRTTIRAGEADVLNDEETNVDYGPSKLLYQELEQSEPIPGVERISSGNQQYLLNNLNEIRGKFA